jgi:uncharacterized membrane protein YkvA (DUF1232 family)
MDPKFLPVFAGWLRTMGEDVLSLANLLDSPEAPEAFRSVSAEALHYLLRSADLIPEGLEALGYLEELLTDDELRAAVLRDAREWAELYRAPELGDGREEIVKIASFFRTRLRRAS